ncbi:MAG TPA: hypothetical protein VGU73_02280 [Acidimicrobiia bacterium]|nr:hypothetical protein [Acidimicrobiia bacterium]
MSDQPTARPCGLRIWPRTPAGRVALGIAIVFNVGLAADAFVVRPLVATPPDPKPIVRALLVVAIAALALARRGVAWIAPDSDDLGNPRTWVGQLEAARGPADPQPLAAHLSEDAFEVFWDGPPGPPPAPWQPSRSGWVWEAEPGRLSASASDPLPTLVRLGETATGALWLNLGAFRLVALVGAAEETTPLLAAVAGELARIAGAEPVESVAVGDADQQVDVDAALALLWRRAAHRPRRQRVRRQRRRPHDALAPLVVAVPRDAPAGTVDRLVNASIGDPDVTLLVDGDADRADLRLTCREGRVEVPCLGDVTAAIPRAAPRPGPPEPVRPSPVPEPEHASAAHPRVQVCLLGEVEIHGASGPRAGKCLELVAYLACHPGGAPDHQIRAALWPDAPPTAATWANRVSVARKALGADDTGEPYLRRFRRHVGQLAPTVGTDVDVIEAALGAASSASPAAAAATLAAALTAVRGRPFDLAFYSWASHEGHIERCERVVADATHRLVELALGAGDARRAVWAVAQGLRACPDSETLRDDAARARAASRAATPPRTATQTA